MRSASGIDQSLNLSFEWDAYYQEINSNGVVYEDGGVPLSTAPFGQVNIEFGVLSAQLFVHSSGSTAISICAAPATPIILPSFSPMYNIGASSLSPSPIAK